MNSHFSTDRFSRQRSILALSLIAPVTSIGALCSTVIAPGAIGQAIALACGLWLLLFPICWHVFIDRQKLRLRIARNDGWLVGTILGILMLAIILASYWWVGRYWLDVADIRSRFDRLGMNASLMVYGFGTFQTLVNSAIEEYVWRWFVYRHCSLLTSKSQAVWISAGLFTVHHVILMAVYCQDWRSIAIGSLAVFIAGAIWARCMRVFGSLLSCYISHLLADLALQIVSWHVLLA